MALKTVFMPINNEANFIIPDLKIFDIQKHEDQRGSFLKIYSRQFGIDFSNSKSHEIFYNVSKKNSLRGMHFLQPPFASTKLVHCLYGSVLDVVLDLRKNSPAFKKFVSFTLSAENPQVLLIPVGCAHGFLSLEEHSTLLYFQNSEYDPNYDSGILWSSFGFDWPNFTPPIISKRDQILPSLNQFLSPF